MKKSSPLYTKIKLPYLLFYSVFLLLLFFLSIITFTFTGGTKFPFPPTPKNNNTDRIETNEVNPSFSFSSLPFHHTNDRFSYLNHEKENLIVFLHIPKTGGSSLNSLMLAQGEKNEEVKFCPWSHSGKAIKGVYEKSPKEITLSEWNSCNVRNNKMMKKKKNTIT